MVKGCGAHAWFHLAGQGRGRYGPGFAPCSRRRGTQQRAVTGKAELAPGAPLRTLIDHTADAFGIGRMERPVEHNLGHRAASY